MSSTRDSSTKKRAPQSRERTCSLGDRAESKLTLEDELFDILYAFGSVKFVIHQLSSKSFFGIYLKTDQFNSRTFKTGMFSLFQKR